MQEEYPGINLGWNYYGFVHCLVSFIIWGLRLSLWIIWAQRKTQVGVLILLGVAAVNIRPGELPAVAPQLPRPAEWGLCLSSRECICADAIVIKFKFHWQLVRSKGLPTIKIPWSHARVELLVSFLNCSYARFSAGSVLQKIFPEFIELNNHIVLVPCMAYCK